MGKKTDDKKPSLITNQQQTQLPALPTLSDSQSLNEYIQYVNKVPMLKEGEEKELAEKLRYQNDLQAAQRLILSHLRFVVKVARGFAGYGLPMTDLIQEGNIGLMKAVRRFDPEMGVRLVSFSVHWIKAEMHEYILKNWRIVKVATTKSQRKLFFNLRRNKKRLGWFSDQEIQSVADTLGVKPEHVKEMEKRMNAFDSAFDAPVEADEDTQSAALSPSLYLEDQTASPEESYIQHQVETQAYDKLKQAIDALEPRSRDIILSRWFADKKETLHALAKRHEISAERVRQIEDQAMKQLKKQVGSFFIG